MLTDLAFLISTLSLFHLFIQYGKNIFLKDFFHVGTGLLIEVDDDLNFVEKRNLHKSRGSLVVNNLLFIKKANLLRQRLLTNELNLS